jgi:hypothetical protein
MGRTRNVPDFAFQCKSQRARTQPNWIGVQMVLQFDAVAQPGWWQVMRQTHGKDAASEKE